MQELTPKRSTEKVLYTFDWNHQLSGDVIQSFTLVVTGGTVTVSNQAYTDTAVSAVISGGVSGQTSTLLLTVNTQGGQVLVRDISLLVSDTVTAVQPSTTKKRAIIELAYEEISLSEYEFDTTPEEMASGLRKLDALMAELNGPGNALIIPYNFPPGIGQGDLDDESYIPDFGVAAIAIQLAVRIAPAIGKTMSAESRRTLQYGMNALRAATAYIPDRQLPAGTIRGAGAKPWATWRPFHGFPRS